MNAPRRKMVRLLKVFVAIFGIAAIIFILRSVFTQKSVLRLFHSTFSLGDFVFDSSTSIYTLTYKNHKYLSVSIPKETQKPSNSNCKVSESKYKNNLCLEWNNIGKLEVYEAVMEETVRCYNIVWTSKSDLFKPMDCLVLSPSHWYGGPSLKSQQWPLEEVSIDMTPYISAHITPGDHHSRAFGSVIERYWINSEGLGIFVDNSVPLHVSINNANDKYLCFKSDYSVGDIYPNPDNNFPVLRYSVCKASNVRIIHDYLFKKCFNIPLSSPDEEIMKYPIWSTYSRFRENVTQTDVLTLVNNIHKQGFPASAINIEQGYERGIGDFNFNNTKFRNAHQMIGELKESKFKVLTAVNPLIVHDSSTYIQASKNKYFMMKAIGDYQQYNFTYNNKNVSLLDFTNSEAVKWFKTTLDSIKTDHLINSFKFNLGEANFLSSKMISESLLHNPCEFTTKYVELAHTFGNEVIVQAGHQTQKFPVYVEVGERTSTWDKGDGLPSVITTVLTYGLLGYPFVIPGPIGGVSQAINRTTGIPVIPDRELYIRWLQISAYLPVMQFSVAPWQYDEEVVKIAKDFVRIHETKVLPLLLLAAKETQINGAPLIRPVWWIAPEDKTALRIDCEFLVGDDLLVAPILFSSDQRDIYLPEDSRWEDQLHGTHHDGGEWLTSYDVKLHEIPTFKRVKTPL